MTTEKRGSEKLLNAENGLCSLTAEELSQVAGGIDFRDVIKPYDIFPLGTVNPDLLKGLNSHRIGLTVDPGQLMTGMVNVGRVSNGY